jgi:hypothetical protein
VRLIVRQHSSYGAGAFARGIHNPLKIIGGSVSESKRPSAAQSGRALVLKTSMGILFGFENSRI